MNVEGALGQEYVALARTPHERQAFSGECLLQELRRTAAFEGEIDIALVGHHRSLTCQEWLAKANA
jgi:hypothetical protein